MLSCVMLLQRSVFVILTILLLSVRRTRHASMFPHGVETSSCMAYTMIKTRNKYYLMVPKSSPCCPDPPPHNRYTRQFGLNTFILSDLPSPFETFCCAREIRSVPRMRDIYPQGISSCNPLTMGGLSDVRHRTRFLRSLLDRICLPPDSPVKSAPLLPVAPSNTPPILCYPRVTLALLSVPSVNEPNAIAPISIHASRWT